MRRATAATSRDCASSATARGPWVRSRRRFARAASPRRPPSFFRRPRDGSSSDPAGRRGPRRAPRPVYCSRACCGRRGPRRAGPRRTCPAALGNLVFAGGGLAGVPKYRPVAILNWRRRAKSSISNFTTARCARRRARRTSRRRVHTRRSRGRRPRNRAAAGGRPHRPRERGAQGFVLYSGSYGACCFGGSCWAAVGALMLVCRCALNCYDEHAR